MMISHKTVDRTISVLPSERLNFIRSQLGEHDAVKLTVTEAADATSLNARGPLAHSLTIERYGKGFRVQDIAVNSDGLFTIGENIVTRHGRFFENRGSSTVTERAHLQELLQDCKLRPKAPQDRYHNSLSSALLDRLVILEDKTNDVRSVEFGQRIDVRKRDLDEHLRRACKALGVDEVSALLRSNQLEHPLKTTIDTLLPLAKRRAAQVQLSTTLNATGLAGFTFSGDDMM